MHERIAQTQLLAAAGSEEEANVNYFAFFSSSSTAFAPPFHPILFSSCSSPLFKIFEDDEQNMQNKFFVSVHYSLGLNV